jgi:hypothetical protein
MEQTYFIVDFGELVRTIADCRLTIDLHGPQSAGSLYMYESGLWRERQLRDRLSGFSYSLTSIF